MLIKVENCVGLVVGGCQLGYHSYLLLGTVAPNILKRDYTVERDLRSHGFNIELVGFKDPASARGLIIINWTDSPLNSRKWCLRYLTTFIPPKSFHVHHTPEKFRPLLTQYLGRIAYVGYRQLVRSTQKTYGFRTIRYSDIPGDSQAIFKRL